MDKLMNIKSENQLKPAKSVTRDATSKRGLKVALGVVGNQDGPLFLWKAEIRVMFSRHRLKKTISSPHK